MAQTETMDDRIGSAQAYVPPLLAQLRNGTRAAHDRIEAIPGLEILLTPDLSAGAYIAALKALCAFQAGLHQRLPKLLHGVAGLNWPDADVLQALKDDLAWFGVALPRPAAGPRIVRDAATALGALYLLEGSQLGGRVIGKSVSRSLFVSPGRGGSFFCGRTADNARQRWQDFCAVLAREGDRMDDKARARVVAGARASFAYFESMLGGSAAPPASNPPAVGQFAALPGEAVRIVN